MSDLIKRINKGPSVGDLEIALEAKDAEIERLKESLEIEQDAYDILAKDHAKLQAVVDDIASQGKTDEFDSMTLDEADIEGAYDIMIQLCRSVATLDTQEGDRPPGFDCECGAHGPSECVCGAADERLADLQKQLEAKDQHAGEQHDYLEANR